MAKDPRPSTTVETTLYDLISALSDELEPEEEALILPILIDLMNSGRIKFVDGDQRYKIDCS
jgi:hypothetical protein